jgi:hypothetical protein
LIDCVERGPTRNLIETYKERLDYAGGKDGRKQWIMDIEK